MGHERTMRLLARVKQLCSYAAIVAAGCSNSKEQAPPTKQVAPAPALAPKERMMAEYEAIFQTGPDLPRDAQVELFLAKIGAPKRVDGETKNWFARDAEGACHEMTFDKSYILMASQIYDKARADAECGVK